MEKEDILNIPDPKPHPSALLASSSSIPGPPLSKNAQKKLAKAAILAEKRKEKRAYQKEKKKEAKRLKTASKQSEGEDAGEGEEGAGEEADVHKRKRARLEEGVSNKRRRGGRKPFKARVVIDLGFDDLMSENVSCVVYCSLSPRPRTSLYSGNQIFDISTRIHLFCQSKNLLSFRIRVIHLINRTNA